MEQNEVFEAKISELTAKSDAKITELTGEVTKLRAEVGRVSFQITLQCYFPF
jgi:peptidoglycan hydrolase CwlO-like protein